MKDGTCQKLFVKFRAGNLWLTSAPRSGRPVQVNQNEILLENNLHYSTRKIANILQVPLNVICIRLIMLASLITYIFGLYKVKTNLIVVCKNIKGLCFYTVWYKKVLHLRYSETISLRPGLAVHSNTWKEICAVKYFSTCIS